MAMLCKGSRWGCFLLLGVLSRPTKIWSNIAQLAATTSSRRCAVDQRTDPLRQALQAQSLHRSCTELSSCSAAGRFGRPWQRGLTPQRSDGMHGKTLLGLSDAASRLMRLVAKQSARCMLTMHPGSILGIPVHCMFKLI
jgi:hypothetical protein